MAGGGLTEDAYYPILAKQLHSYKETEGGRAIMCKAVEDQAVLLKRF
jgi:hypothetical protein